MRLRRLWGLVCLPGLLPLAQACVSDEPSPPGLASPEAGLPDTAASPGTDAAAKAPDGGPVVPDAAVAPVTVFALGPNGEPIAGAKVVVGGTSTVLTADATGKVVSPFQAPGTVTVQMVFDGSGSVGTDTIEYFHYVDVEPGDVLRAQTSYAAKPAPPRPVVAKIDVTLPARAAGNSYFVSIGCDTAIPKVGANPGLLFVTEDCIDAAGNVSLVATAAESGTAVAAWQTVSVPIASADAGVGDAAPAVSVTLPQASWVAATPATLAAVGTPIAQALSFTVTVDQMKNGLSFHHNGPDEIIASTMTVEPIPGPFADLVQTIMHVDLDDIDAGAITGLGPFVAYVRQAPPPIPTTADYAAFPPPLFVTAVGANKSQPRLEWTGGNKAAAGAVAVLEGGGYADAGLYVAVRWNFVFPASATFVEAPVLPASMTVAPIEEGWFPNALGIVESPQLPSYKAFKSDAVRFIPYVRSRATSAFPKGAFEGKISGVGALPPGG